ncbi:MAG: hypothetical protein AAF393_10580 [Pseudomonadota bacterium]
MATPKLSGPVGLDPRESKGAPVKNSKSDVVIIQVMLNANDITVPINGKMDGATLKGIDEAQRRVVKLRTPDKVIDPGGTSWKKLFPKFDTFWKKAESEAEAIKRQRADLDKALRAKSKAKYMVLSKYEAMYYSLLKNRQDMKFGCWLVETFKRASWPGSRPLRAAHLAYSAYDRAIAAGDYKKLPALAKVADRAIEVFVKTISNYYQRVISPTWAGTYLSMANFSMNHVLPIVVLTLTTAALTPFLLGAAGLTLATASGWALFVATGSAAAASAVLTKGIKDVTTATGKYLAGNKIQGYKSLYDGFKAYGLTALEAFIFKAPLSGWCTSAIKTANFKYLLRGGVMRLSDKASKTLARVGVNELFLFFDKYIKGSGKNTAKATLKKVSKSLSGKERQDQIAEKFVKSMLKNRGFQVALDAHLNALAK